MEQKAISSQRWQIIVAFAAFIFIGLNDGAIGVLIPGIQAHYSINKAIVSLLFLGSSFGYLAAAFNSGFMVAKLGIRRYLALSFVLICCSTLGISLAPPFPVLALLLIPIGFGLAMLDAGLNAYVAVLPRNNALLNYLHAFYGIGALAGPIIASSILLAGLGWNNAYSIWMVLSALLLVEILFVYKKPVNIKAEHQEGLQQKAPMRTVLGMMIVWLPALFLLAYVGAEVSLGNWSFSFLTQQRQLPTLFSAWIVSGYWLGLTLGRLAMANLTHLLTERVMIQICLLGTLIAVLLVWLVPVGIVSAIGLCLTGFFLGPIFPTTIALMPQIVPARLLTTAIGLLASLASMGGALFPWIAGNLAQALGIWVILPYFIVLALIMLLLWIILQFRVSKQQSVKV